MLFVRQLINKVSGSPVNLFWFFALTHLFFWTLIPSLVSQNLPVDVIEGYAWGKEWLIGTYKHPPMQAWILEAVNNITGRVRWAPYLTSQIAVITAFWAVWQTGRHIAGEKAGLLGAMILEGVVYYNFTSPEFNPNVLQLPFWALTGWSFYRAIKEDKLADWILCGIWAAAALYTKYSSAIFFVSLAGAMLAHRDGRKRLLGLGPYAALITAFALFLPHLVWLFHNDFLPWLYATGRLERHPHNYSSLTTTALMVAGQLIALLFAIILLVSLYDKRRSPERAPAESFDRIFLTFAAFGPFLCMFCLSLFFGYHIRDMWQTPFWNFTGLWAIVFLRPAMHVIDMRRFAMAWSVVFATGLILFIANETLSPYVTERPKRTIFPGRNLSETISVAWHNRYHTPLQYVVGDMWPAGNVAWYTEDRPHVFIEGNPRIAPWIDAAELKENGGVIVWCIHCGSWSESHRDEPQELKEAFANAEIQEPITLKRMTFADIPPAVIGWAIIPPQKHPAEVSQAQTAY